MPKKNIFPIYLILIIAVTVCVFYPALRANFVSWDDPDNLTENVFIRHFNAASIKWAFTTFHTGNYIPLTWITHAATYHFWRLDPKAHHLLNIILHCINALLLFILFTNIISLARRREEKSASFEKNTDLLIAAFSALIWAVHPLRVEPVVWVTELKELGCALFFLLSILAYLRCRNQLPSIVFFILALLFKPMALMLPPVLLIIDYWPLKKFSKKQDMIRALKDKIPFFLISFLFFLIAFKAQSAKGAVAATDTVSLLFRVMNSFHSIVFYIEKTLIPLKLTPFYPLPIACRNPMTFENLFSLAAVALISLAAVLSARKEKPYILAAWLFYIVTLIPVIGIIQIGSQIAADRYTYIPTMSIIFLFVAAIVRAGKTALTFILLIIFLFAALTVQQIRIWGDSLTLWKHIANIYPNSSRIINTNLANAYRLSGDPDAAIEEYRRAISLSNPHPYIHDGLGCALLDKGLVDQAIAEFKTAISIDAAYAASYRNLWFAYTRKNEDALALEAIKNAIRIDPNFARAYSNLGISYAKKGLFDESKKAFVSALAIDPDNDEYLANLATTYSNSGELDKAIVLYKKAIALNPKQKTYRINLSNTLRKKDMAGH